MTLTPLRSNDAYFAFGKQSVQGTAVAPSVFPRWVDGTKLEMDAKMEDVWEGDGSRRLSFILKNMQNVKATHMCYPRPNEVAFFESAAMGSGSDTYTAPATGVSLTTSGAGNTAGSTTLTLSASTGLGSSGSYNLVLSAGTVNEEVVTVTTPGTTNAFTVTIPATGLRFTHANGQTAEGAAQHVLVDTVDGAYYTIEIGLGGTSGIILRVKDCKCNSIKRSSKSGTLFSIETEWEGLTTAVQASALTPTFDMHSPFIFQQGVWTLDGVTSGDALYVDMFDIAQKNNLDVTQTERLTPDASIFGNINVDVSTQWIFQNGQRIRDVYFGSATGTADSQTVYTGTLVLLFTQPDQFHTLQYSVPTMNYTKATVPEPKHDGKAWRQPVSASSTSNMSANTYLLQTTVTDTTYSAN